MTASPRQDLSAIARRVSSAFKCRGESPKLSLCLCVRYKEVSPKLKTNGILIITQTFCIETWTNLVSLIMLTFTENSDY